MKTSTLALAGILAFSAVLTVRAQESAPTAPAPITLQSALDRALDDERHASAYYAAVTDTLGSSPPFSNIQQAEQRHESALLAQYHRLGLMSPADTWANRAFDVPTTIREACDAAEVIEVRNVRMYDELIAAIDDDAVRDVFAALRAASADRHLPAFQRFGSGWAPIKSDALSPSQSVQRTKAEAARTAMYNTIVGTLMNTFTNDGLAAAVGVCADEAPKIADRIATEQGVRIGRTSWKLRNVANQPPVWAELVVDARPEKPSFLADRSGRLGAVLPIRVSAFCLQCHGDPETLDPEVRAQLATHYPNDAATGFREGDLRGWFWVEVPPPTP